MAKDEWRKSFSFWKRGSEHRQLKSYYREFDEKYPGYRRVAIMGIAAITCVVLLGVGVAHVVRGTNGKPIQGSVEAVPPTAVEVPDNGTLTTVRKQFGPWELLAVQSGTHSPNLLMLMGSGSTDVSAWTVTIRPEEWLKAQPFSIRTIQVNGRQVIITDDHGQSYEVSAMQPFMFESDPTQVYFVSKDHQIWSTSYNSASTNRSKA